MPPPIPVSNADRARHAIGLLEQGQHKAAERLLKDVLKADPAQFDALLAMGVLSGMRGHDTDAVRHLSRAVRKSPHSDVAQYNLGQALIRLGRHQEAADALTAAVAVADQPHIHEKLADSLRQLGRLDEAVRHYRRAVELAGQRASGMLLSSLVESQRRICDWEDLDVAQGRLIDLAKRGDPVEPLLLTYVVDDPALLKRNAVVYATAFLPATVPHIAAQHPAATRVAASRQPSRDLPPGSSLAQPNRLRVGYLCSDFRNHATAHLMAELFESHDRAAFETFALSFGPDDKGPMRQRLERAFDRFVDMSHMSSQDIVKRIRALGIDILVDLNGYIANARPEILMARPSPVQCHYLAFPGTLGSPAIDYLLVDPIIGPPEADVHFAEKLVRLPDCYQPNDSRRVIAADRPTRAACGLPERGIVLASFNNAIKLAPDMFAIWMRVLAAVPDSVLWLYSDNAWVPDKLRGEAHRAGIAADRLVFAGYASSADHLARLAHADLLLDSFPYGAHTTASDALWMGVPVLTLAGRSFASLVGASLLTAVGLPELVMRSLDAYEREAIALARDPHRIAALKSRLTANRSTCRLFDTQRLARNLETAYSEMWRRRCAGEAPGSFDVATLPQ